MLFRIKEKLPHSYIAEDKGELFFRYVRCGFELSEKKGKPLNEDIERDSYSYPEIL